jgi:hypothetical protein
LAIISTAFLGGDIVDQQHVAEWLEAKGSDKQTLADEAAENPSIVGSLVNCLSSEKTSVRHGCEKILRLLSEKRPELVYPYFGTFANLLSSQNSFLKWGAIITIANLSKVDVDRRFDPIFNKYFRPITGPVLITAANIIGHAWKIALFRPDLTEKIARWIVATEEAVYRHHGEVSSECKNIACAHAIDSLDRFYEKIEDKRLVADFVRRQLDNPREAVSKKARRFLKKRSIDS